jgi:lambda family phage tail tape measure protein
MATTNSETNKEYILSVKLALDPSIQAALNTLGAMRKELDSVSKELNKAAKEFAAQGGDATKAAEALKKYNDTLKGVDSTQSNMRGSADAQRSMQGWAAAVGQLESELTTLPQKLALTQAKLNELRASGQQGTATWQAYSSELRRLTDVQNKLNATNAGTAQGFRGLRFAAQNASFQFTDMAVSLQGGQRASMVMAQQIPQLLGGFGAVGAALGLVASLGAAAFAPMIDKMFSASNGAKQLEDANKSLGEAVGLVGETAKTFSMDPLIKQFNAANAVTRQTIIEQQKLQLELIETQRVIAAQALASATSSLGQFSFTDKLKGAFGDSQSSQLAKQFGVAESAGADLLRVVKDISAGSIDAANALQLVGPTLAKSANPEAQKLLKTLMDTDKAQRDNYAATAKLSETIKSMGDAGATGLVALEKPAKVAKAAIKDLNDEFLLIRDVFKDMAKGAADRIEMPIRSEIIKENTETWIAWGYSQKQINAILAKQDEAFKKSTETWTIYDATQKQILEDAEKWADYTASVEKYLMLWEGGFINLDELNIALETIQKFKPAIDASANSAKEAKSAYEEMTVAVGTVLGNSISSLTDVLFESKKSFREWASDVLMELAKVLIKLAVVQAFKTAMKASGYGAMFGFAAGGAFAMPTGLPTNQVIDSPHLFKFAQGGSFGVAGEAGAEAIVPLKRTSSGDLGVQASPVNIQINNTISQDAKVEVAENQQPDGTRQITLTIRREMKSAMSDGSMDAAMKTNYGTSRRAM